MDNVFINLGDMVSIGQDSVSVFDSDNIISTSDALVGPPGPPGPPGQPGKNGRDGISPTVTVGTTTTTAPDTNAVVTNSGTTEDLILDFSIPRGATGATGPAGADGSDGVDGYSPTAIVTQTAGGSTITITDANGTTSADVYNGYSPSASVTKVGDTATITITDENGTTTASISDGQDGTPGTPGQAATITVGSTTTGSAGTNASVTNTGTTSAAILDFVIPRGADGQNGQDGQDGAPGQAATISVGTTTTGAAGTNASVTNSGTSSAAVFNFTIPRGDTGAAGQDGQDGAAASVAVGTTTTGAAGTNASVTNSGTSSAAVLNFTIPRGADGADGTDGTDGTDGVTPSITASATVSNTTGTPSCSVTKSGTDANPNFAFAFTNIKGDKGDSASNIPVRLWYGNISTGDVTLNDDIDNYPVLLTLWGGVGDHTLECHPIVAWSTQYTNNGASFAGWRTSSSNPDIQARVNNTNVYGYVNTQTKITIQSNNSSRNLRLILGIKK